MRLLRSLLAVLFYVHWDQNCHVLAGLWDQIAHLLQAGTRASGLVMALFDCEGTSVSHKSHKKSTQSHAALCEEAGVSGRYPSVLYVSGTQSGEVVYRDLKRTSRYPHTAMYRGDWKNGEALMDWLAALQALGRWQRFTSFSSFSSFSATEYSSPSSPGPWPWASVLRGLLVSPFRGGGRHGRGRTGQPTESSSSSASSASSASLPVGIPPQWQLPQPQPPNNGNGTAAAAAAGGSDAAALREALAQTAQLERQLQELRSQKDDLEKGTRHSSQLLDALLFSSSGINDINDNTTSLSSKEEEEQVDVFAELYPYWDDYPNMLEQLQSSASDSSTSSTSTSTSTSTNVWTDPRRRLATLQSCVVDVVLDYCTRFWIRNALETYDMLDAELGQHPHFGRTPAERQYRIDEINNRTEPYCDILEPCMASNFATDECRPATCPFVTTTTTSTTIKSTTTTTTTKVGCLYANTCRDYAVEREYKEALDTILSSMTMDTDGTASAGASASASATVGGNKPNPTADGKGTAWGVTA